MLRYLPSILIAAFAMSACDNGDRVVDRNYSTNDVVECRVDLDACPKPDPNDKR